MSLFYPRNQFAPLPSTKANAMSSSGRSSDSRLKPCFAPSHLVKTVACCETRYRLQRWARLRITRSSLLQTSCKISQDILMLICEHLKNFSIMKKGRKVKMIVAKQPSRLSTFSMFFQRKNKRMVIWKESQSLTSKRVFLQKLVSLGAIAALLVKSSVPGLAIERRHKKTRTDIISTRDVPC